MKTALRLMVLTIMASLFLPGCQKLFDYIKDNPGEAKKYCKVKKLKRWQSGEYSEVNIAYNTAGNPVSMLGNDWEYRFRYDKKNKLTDYIFNLHGSPGAMLWNRFSYPSQKLIVDTAFFYSGLVADVIPPNASTAYDYNVYHHELDTKGRIYKSSMMASDGSVDHVTYYGYDAQGNRTDEYTTYDDKVNPYRTNPVWSFVYWDYSLNNPLYTNHPLNGSNQIIAYNDWGLPVRIVSDGVQIFGYRYDSLEIEYECKK